MNRRKQKASTGTGAGESRQREAMWLQEYFGFLKVSQVLVWAGT